VRSARRTLCPLTARSRAFCSPLAAARSRSLCSPLALLAARLLLGRVLACSSLVTHLLGRHSPAGLNCYVSTILEDSPALLHLRH
jgi:hypothetical protein